VREFDFVHAFEPVAEYADAFELNVIGNRWLHRMALGDATRSVGIRQYPENTGQTHVDGDGDTPMITLDSFMLRTVDLIKIDVEGYELHVAMGAVETLILSRPVVVIEERPTAADNFAPPDGAARRFLESLGMVTLGREHFDYVMGWP